MVILRKAVFVAVLLGICLLGFWLGIKIAGHNQREVETGRMETCLKLYREYRQNNDQKKLSEELQKIGFSPLDFQKIIDRFIYYRTRKSSINQAMHLLKAFRMGYNVEPAQVVEVSGFASEPFRLDAEILAVFEEKPALVENAFEG